MLEGVYLGFCEFLCVIIVCGWQFGFVILTCTHPIVAYGDASWCVGCCLV